MKNILENEDVRMDIIKTELNEVKEKYGDERRSTIEYGGGDFRIEDMIQMKKLLSQFHILVMLKELSLLNTNLKI